MVRPRRPAEYGDVEACDSTTLLQGDTVPVWISSPLPSTESICEERVRFEDIALARQRGKILRISIRATRIEPA